MYLIGAKVMANGASGAWLKFFKLLSGFMSFLLLTLLWPCEEYARKSRFIPEIKAVEKVIFISILANNN
jgi:hypothetical protein